MKTAFFTTILTLTFTAGSVLAADDAKDFATKKAEISKEVDEHIKALQDHKVCIDAASDHNALKACREKMKDFRQGNMMERMGDRKERLEKRMEKMKEKQKK